MGPCLAAYAAHHGDSENSHDGYTMSCDFWNGFMKTLREKQDLIDSLADCVLTTFPFDPDMPDSIRDPKQTDWKNLAAFELWFTKVFTGKDCSRTAVFSLTPEHFYSGVERAFALRKWEELDSPVRQALLNPENMIRLSIG